MDESMQEIKISVAEIKSDMKHIIEKLTVLPCNSHLEGIAELKANALLKAAEVKAETLLEVVKLKEQSDCRLVAIEKKQDRLVTVWATISGSLALILTIVMILKSLGIL